MSFHNYTKKRNRLETNLCSRKSIQAPGLWSCGCGGKRGVGENPSPARVLVFWAGRCGRTVHTFHEAPGGYLAVLSHWPHTAGGGQGAAPGTRFSISSIHRIHRRSWEKNRGPGAALCPADKRRQGRQRGWGWVVPTQARILGQVHSWSTGRPSGGLLDSAS